MKIKELSELEDLLPLECIEQMCTPGMNDEACYVWAETIHFNITRKDAVDILIGYGAWEQKELNKMPMCDLKLKLLWLAAWNVSENQTCEEA